MPLDAALFKQRFDSFRERIHRASGKPFVSFGEGLPAAWEAYKALLRQKALSRLAISSMADVDVGNGAILERLISAIEVAPEPDGEANNLVQWQNRFGHASRSHRVLLDARDDPSARRTIETWALEFYKGALDAALAFEQMRKIAGSRYDLLGYLFFLKDWDRYVPIAPKTFDRAFKEIGIDPVTRQQCSWSNYERYNAAMADIRRALEDVSGLAGIRLIDAHSFCWLLVREELDGAGPVAAAPTKATPPKKMAATIFSARQKSVAQMAATTLNTVSTSNGQQMLVAKKAKDFWMSPFELEKYIYDLLERQQDRCNLTGIPFQWQGEYTDLQLLPSLDRIDSNGHYAKGNLQGVCRFINFWKGNTPNDEFKRLLSMVRGGEHKTSWSG